MKNVAFRRMTGSTMAADPFAAQRQQLMASIRMHSQLAAATTGKVDLDDRVMDAIAKVPRHEFVPVEIQAMAYADVPLPIGHGKTISQPFIVAMMTDLLDLRPDDSVLEIGTGLGYQAAVLAELAGAVYSVELIEELAQSAKRRLKRQGYTNIKLRVANGFHGWPEHAPFDKIIATAAPDLIPSPLIYQLKPGGRMVLPVGLPNDQHLILVEKDGEGRLTTRELLQVRFSVLDDPEQPTSRPS
jgi:protein-L-isoaspartate(D-aspartate) O-methyltransferase